MPARPRRSAPGIALRAAGLGLVAAIVLPLILMFGVLGLAHLGGSCGAGSSGGCEMGAASLGLFAVIPAFVIGAVIRRMTCARIFETAVTLETL